MRITPGCSPCKLRKKKCDGMKPVCAACTRNGLLCSSWIVEVQNKTQSKSNTDRSSKGRRHGPISRQDVNAPARQPVLTPNKTLKIDSEMTGPCKLYRASTGPLAVKNLHPDISNVMLSREENCILWQHYLDCTGILSSGAVAGVSPFIHTLAPAASASDMIFHALLAFSGFHLMRNSNAIPLHVVLEHYGQAIQKTKYGLTKLSTSTREDHTFLFASILILCCIELVKNDGSSSVLPHLEVSHYVACQMIQSTPATTFLHDPNTSQMDSLALFNIELYAYLLIITLASVDNAHHIRLVQDSEMILDLMKATEHPVYASGFFFGSARQLFYLIPTVASIATRASTSEDGPTTLRAIAYLLSQVEQWSPMKKDQSFDTCGRIYQLALKFLLHDAVRRCASPLTTFDSSSFRRVNSSLESQSWGSLSQHYVTQFMRLLTELSINCSIVTTLCWPLVILGSCAYSQEQKEIVQQFLAQMEEHYNWGNISLAGEILQEAWEQQNNTLDFGPIDSLHSMQERCVSLTLA